MAAGVDMTSGLLICMFSHIARLPCVMRDIPRLRAEFFKTIGHPLRIRILELLAPGERSVADLRADLHVSQPHLSQQLGILRRAGFVVSRRDAGGAVYALADERIVDLLALSRAILLDMVTATRDELHSS